MIIYPDAGYQSFISVGDADTTIGSFVESAGKTAYLALDIPGKEAILTQSSLQIELAGCTLPAQNEKPLELATCYLSTSNLAFPVIEQDPNGRSITQESVGDLSVSYSVNDKSQGAFPAIVTQLLEQYTCQVRTGGISQFYRAT